MEPSASPPRAQLGRLIQTWRFARQPFALLHELRERHGDVFAVDLVGFGEVVVICDPALMAEVHRLDDDGQVAGQVRGRFLGDLVGPRVSMRLDGEAHQRRRRAEAPGFGARRMMAQIPRFQSRISELLAGWPVGRAYALQAGLDEIALELALDLFFGEPSAERRERLRDAARSYLATMRPLLVPRPRLRWNLGPFNAWGRFHRARRGLERVLAAEVEARRQSSPRDPVAPVDLFGMLLAAPLEDDPRAQIEAVQHEICGLLVGGTDTVAKSIAWTLLGLLQTPEFHHRVRDEIDTISKRRPVDRESLSNMPYFGAVILEGLRAQRLTPLLGFRQVLREVELGDYTLVAGTVVAQAHAETGRHDGFPYPHRFHPDNFFERQVTFREYLPFGGGRRICTGMAFGQLEMSLVIAMILQRFDVTLVRGRYEPKPSGLAFEPHELVVRLSERPDPTDS